MTAPSEVTAASAAVPVDNPYERLHTILESVSSARSPTVYQANRRRGAAIAANHDTTANRALDGHVRATLDMATLLQRSLDKTGVKRQATDESGGLRSRLDGTVDVDQVIEGAFRDLTRTECAANSNKRVRFASSDDTSSESDDDVDRDAVSAMMVDQADMNEEQRRDVERRRSLRRAARKKQRDEERAQPPTRAISSLQFGLLSPEEMRRLSVVEITKQRYFDHAAPVEGGLYDLRMGTTMRQFKCQSCDLRFKDCPGHFGRIELATPVYHPLFLDMMIKVLNCVCLDCSALLVPKSKRFVKRQERSKRSQDRLRHVYDLIKSKTTNKQCCGTPANERFRVPLGQLYTGIDPKTYRNERFSNTQQNRCAEHRFADNTLEQGCGHYQPKVVRDGLKVMLNYPALPASVVKARQAALNAEAAAKSANNSAVATSDDDNDSRNASSKKAKQDTGGVREKEFDRVRRERAGQTIDMMPEEALAILQRISEEDCWLLGFNPHLGHPAWMVFWCCLWRRQSCGPP